MRILLVWDYYDAYLRYHYAQTASRDLPYQAQYEKLLADFFTWPPFLLPYLEKGGHTARLIVGNAEPLQRAWAKENGVEYSRIGLIREQIRRFKPDVLWVAPQPHYLGEFLTAVPDKCQVLLWSADESYCNLDLKRIDCVLTSHGGFAQYFRSQGKRTHQLWPCFPEEALEVLHGEEKSVGVSFSGSLAPASFQYRIRVINHLVRQTPIELWANIPKFLKRPWRVKHFFQQFVLVPVWTCPRRNAPVFGVEMLKLLKQSKMTFNVQGDVNLGFSGNIRLFEATGVGTLLVTERTADLKNLFEPEREVVTFSNKEEAAERINYLLEHERVREEIAARGQQRTLRDHNAAKRAEEFLEIVRSKS